MEILYPGEPGSYYIGHSNDGEIRYKASSGGIGSAIIRFLLEHRNYGTSMTFVFNREKCRYDPKLIYDYKDYNNCGSIYQDTDTIGFIRDNIDNIKNGIIVTCMPCQVRAIKSILGRKNIEHFVISLCCSGQTTVQGTWCYYKLLGIRKEDVDNIQYRGNGWPSGIQISLKNGKKVCKPNYSYPWTIIQQSLLYRPKRCLNCTIKTSPHADVSLADPWLKEYVERDKIGNTVAICNNRATRLFENMIDQGVLSLNKIDKSIYLKSQLGTVEVKANSNKHKSFNKIIYLMGRDNYLYKKIFASSAFTLKVQVFILKIIHKFL